MLGEPLIRHDEIPARRDDKRCASSAPSQQPPAHARGLCAEAKQGAVSFLSCDVVVSYYTLTPPAPCCVRLSRRRGATILSITVSHNSL